MGLATEDYFLPCNARNAFERFPVTTSTTGTPPRVGLSFRATQTIKISLHTHI